MQVCKWDGKFNPQNVILSKLSSTRKFQKTRLRRGDKEGLMLARLVNLWESNKKEVVPGNENVCTEILD